MSTFIFGTVNKRIKISFFLLLIVCGLAASERPVAVKGELDLTDYDFSEQGVLKIEGDWRFYWQEFIDPDKPQPQVAKIIPVPSAWNQLDDIIPEIEGKGFASYHLRVTMPANLDRAALRFTEVFSASSVYVNGQQIGSNGKPGSNRFETVFSHVPYITFFEVTEPVIDIVVHVSNFEHRSGGIRGTIELGTSVQVMHKGAKTAHRDALLLGAFLIIGILFMSMFFMKSDFPILYFSLICLVTAFRVDLLNTSGFIDYGFLNGITILRLEHLSFDLLIPLFIMLIRSLFPHEFPRIIYRIMLMVCILQILFVVFTPVGMFSTTFPLFMIFVLLVSGVLLAVLFVAWRRGRTYALGFTIGIMIAVVGAVNDLLYVGDHIQTGYISHFTLFTYLVIFAVIFSRKTFLLIRKTETMARELNEMNENLEIIVEERTSELNEKSKQLELQSKKLVERNLELGKIVEIRNKLFTIVGHDIRGPLATTQQLITLLKEDELEEVQSAELLVMIEKSIQATLNLLENLLFWSRSQTGQLTVNPGKVSLKLLADETIEILHAAVVEKSQQLKIDIDDELYVFADPEHVKLVMRNLLSNAIKFTENEGSVRMSAKKSDNGNEVLFRVTDNGAGMPAKVVKELFSTETHHSTYGTAREKGSGIGLKLCLEVLEMNRGWIKVQSKEGEGSTFEFGLPAEA